MLNWRTGRGPGGSLRIAVAALAGWLALLALWPVQARADYYGTKALNADEGGEAPTVLYLFHEDGAREGLLGEIRLDGAGLAVDGAALSPAHGLLAFHLRGKDSRLIRLDPSTASATVVGPLLAGRLVRGAAFAGPERLLAIDVSGPNLLEVDPATGRELRALPLAAPVYGSPDLAVDGACRGYLAYYELAAGGTRFQRLDLETGALASLFFDNDIRPGDRYPIAVGGLALTEAGGDALFAFDSHDMDDVFRYELPLHPGGRSSLYLDVHPAFNAGNVDLAGYVPPAAGECRPTATPTSTSTARPTATSTATTTSTSTSTSTPTPTASSTSTPRPSATASRTPTATRTVRPSPTPTTSPTGTEAATATRPPCVPSSRPADIVLVLDRSSSMEDAGKLSAARAAIEDFVGASRVPPDRLALVTFAGVAGIPQPLTTDVRRLLEALDATVTGPGTRIDLGLRAAREALAAGQDPDRSPVILLLTDGRQNGAPASAAQAEADAAKAAGALIFTIGLGADVDAALLASLATSPGHYYAAPSPADLGAIYRRLARVVPCADIGGRVFRDSDADGRYDPAVDAPLAGVTVTLDGAARWTERTAMLGAGRYLFHDLAAGRYTVALLPADVPAGFAPTTATTHGVDLAGASQLGLDFGLRPLPGTPTPTSDPERSPPPPPTAGLTPTPAGVTSRIYLPSLPFW